MSPLLGAEQKAPDGFPRVSGDEPLPLTARSKKDWFSPRERG